MATERIRQDNEFKVKTDKATQTLLSDTNIAAVLSLGSRYLALIMQQTPLKFTQRYIHFELLSNEKLELIY